MCVCGCVCVCVSTIHSLKPELMEHTTPQHRVTLGCSSITTQLGIKQAQRVAAQTLATLRLLWELIQSPRPPPSLGRLRVLHHQCWTRSSNMPDTERMIAYSGPPFFSQTMDSHHIGFALAPLPTKSLGKQLLKHLEKHQIPT